MYHCFSIYQTSWITSGPKSYFICKNIAIKAILFFFGCSEVNSTWLITSELANQRAQKVLFTCVVYTKNHYQKSIDSININHQLLSVVTGTPIVLFLWVIKLPEKFLFRLIIWAIDWPKSITDNIFSIIFSRLRWIYSYKNWTLWLVKKPIIWQHSPCSGLKIATNTVANATSFFSLATKICV